MNITYVNTYEKAIEVISIYSIANNDIEQYLEFMDWVKYNLHTQSNNLGLFYIERFGNKEKYLHHSDSNSIFIHNQRIIHQVLSILNKQEISKSITYNFIMNHLKKMMTKVKWKRTRIGVTTLGLLMLANLIRKEIRDKLMKSVSIQNGCYDDSLFHDHVLFEGIQKQIPTDDMNKRKQHDLLKILSATLNKEKYFVENFLYIFSYEGQLKRKKLYDYIFYNQFIVYYDDDVNEKVLDRGSQARSRSKQSRNGLSNESSYNDFEERSGITCLHPNGYIEKDINYVWCKISKC